jgi:hypothetical protein
LLHQNIAIATSGANTLSTLKSVSAVKKYPRAHKGRGGENVQWHRIKSLDASVLDAAKISRDAASVLGRLLLFKHLTPLQAEAGRRYAYIVARFEKYSIEGRRTTKSPAYERAYGSDQELERLSNIPDGIAEYEKRAKNARRDYDKLMKELNRFPGAKGVLDDLCCSDIEPPAEWRDNVATVLSVVAKRFGVSVKPRSNKRRVRK